MRIRKSLATLASGALILALTGAECVEDRNVDTVILATISANWHTEGFTQGTSSDTETVDGATDIQDALDDIDGDIESITVTGVCYEVLANAGSAARKAATHQGSVRVDGRDLLDFNSPNTAVGTVGNPGNGRVVMKAAGTAYINQKLADYLASYNAGTPNPAILNGIVFAANWASSPNASQADQDDFDWKTCVFVQIVAKIEIEVLNP